MGAYDQIGSQASPGSLYPGLKTLLLHWNGQTWDQVDSPNNGVGSQLLGFTGSTSLSDEGKIISSNWAVGSYIGSGTSPSQTLIEHITPPTPPIRTTSYYENSMDLDAHYKQGCVAAANHESGIIVLDYGQPVDLGDQSVPYGTYLIGTDTKAYISAPGISTDITRASEKFAKGYDDAFHSLLPSSSCPSVSGPEGVITLSISINNMLNLLSPTEVIGHAQAWASMVKAVQSYVLANLHGNIVVAAGVDAEPNWDPHYSFTKQWASTYSDTNVSPYYAFGSFDGYPCRPSGHPGFPDPLLCSFWTVDLDYTISWGIAEAQPLPEIYKPLDAREWYIVKHWGLEQYPYAPYMNFKGEMTECLSGGCPPQLTSQQAWPIMWLELNSDQVRGISPGASTDIKCSNGVTGNGCRITP